MGSYTHTHLVRGKPDICRFMIRTKIKKKGLKSENKNNKTKLSTSNAPANMRLHSRDELALPRRSKSCPDASSILTNGNIIEPARISSDYLTLDASNNSVYMCAQTAPLQGLPNQTFPSIVPCDKSNKRHLVPFIEKNSQNCSSTTRSMLLSVMNKRAEGYGNNNLAFNDNPIGGQLSFHQEQQHQQQQQQQQQYHFMQQQHQLHQRHLQLQQMQGLQMQQQYNGGVASSSRYPQHVEQQSFNIHPRHTTHCSELDLDTIFEDNACLNRNNYSNYNENNAMVDSCLMTPLAVDTVIDCDYKMVEEVARTISSYQ